MRRNFFKLQMPGIGLSGMYQSHKKEKRGEAKKGEMWSGFFIKIYMSPGFKNHESKKGFKKVVKH